MDLKKINKKTALTYFGIFILGGMIGGTAKSKPVEVIVEKPVTVEKIVEKVEYKTPQACLTLKEIDNRIMGYQAEYFGAMAKATEGTTNQFVLAITNENTRLTTKLQAETEGRLIALEGCN